MDAPKSKWKKSDYRSIRRWVIKALEERKTPSGKKKECAPISNPKFARGFKPPRKKLIITEYLNEEDKNV